MTSGLGVRRFLFGDILDFVLQCDDAITVFSLLLQHAMFAKLLELDFV